MPLSFRYGPQPVWTTGSVQLPWGDLLNSPPLPRRPTGEDDPRLRGPLPPAEGAGDDAPFEASDSPGRDDDPAPHHAHPWPRAPPRAR